MGLYLCIFDQNEEDICGVEVGLYSYFGEFRDLVSKFTNKDFISKVLRRKSKFSLPMTTLLNHSDCDGSWNVEEYVQLKMELEEIKPENLFECFIDSDCEFLIDRLIKLCDLAIQENRPIIFQ